MRVRRSAEWIESRQVSGKTVREDLSDAAALIVVSLGKIDCRLQQLMENAFIDVALGKNVEI